MTREFIGEVNFTGKNKPLKTAAAGLRRAGIDWDVDAVSLSELTGKPGSERWVAAVRQSDDRMIGCNGTRHRIIQNSEMGELADAIIEMNDSFLITGGGSFPNGDKAFLVLTSDHVFTFGQDDDKGFSFILLVNDFNGNSPLTATGGVGRMFCTNQFTGLLRGKTGHRLVSVNHTQSKDWKIVAAKDTLRGLVHEMDQVEIEIQRLLEVEMSAEQATDAASGPRPTEKLDEDGRTTNQRTINDWERKRDVFRSELFAPYNEHLAGTALGAVMAAQGIDEHLSKSLDREVSRVNRVIDADFPTMRRVLAAVS
jgi:hypothetical protein